MACFIHRGDNAMIKLNASGASAAVRNILPPRQKIAEITAEQLKKEMASANPPFLLDVRNQDEFNKCRIEGSHLIPLPILPERYTELDPSRDIVVHCRLGGRSAKAISFLRSKGFTKLRNLTRPAFTPGTL
jgi:rhodanese-related sulfurtransferase